MYMYVVFFLNYFYLNKLIDIIFLKILEIEYNFKLKYLMKQLVYDWIINLLQDLDQIFFGGKFNILMCLVC